MERGGFIKAPRRQYRPVAEGGCTFWKEKRVFSRFEAWEDLRQMAAWAEHDRLVGNQTIRVRIGELIASVRYLSRRWGWTRKRTTSFLDLVTEMGRLRATRRTAKGTIYLLDGTPTSSSRGDSEGTAAAPERGRDGDAEGTATTHEKGRRGDSRVDKVEEGREEEEERDGEDDEEESSDFSPELRSAESEEARRVDGDDGDHRRGAGGVGADRGRLRTPGRDAAGPELTSAEAEEQEAVLAFPVRARKGQPKEWSLTRAKLAEYEEAFDGLEVVAELKKAAQWCRDNPRRRKTAGGMPRFLWNWLGRANDRGVLRERKAGVGSQGGGKLLEVPEPRLTRHDVRQDGRLDERGRKRYSAWHGKSVPIEEWMPFAMAERELGPCPGEVFRG